MKSFSLSTLVYHCLIHFVFVVKWFFVYRKWKMENWSKFVWIRNEQWGPGKNVANETFYPFEIWILTVFVLSNFVTKFSMLLSKFVISVRSRNFFWTKKNGYKPNVPMIGREIEHVDDFACGFPSKQNSIIINIFLLKRNECSSNKSNSLTDFNSTISITQWNYISKENNDFWNLFKYKFQKSSEFLCNFGLWLIKKKCSLCFKWLLCIWWVTYGSQIGKW